MNNPLLFIIGTLFVTALAAEPLEWPSYGGTLAQNRFIDDPSINTGNVSHLKLKWLFQTGVVGSFENTPIVKDGVMYITTPYNHIYALDAGSGKRLWRY
ncbi:MAG: PQQ-binding-like beta-propeller repeat protein, partial [Methyloprofundus sp.]|nr:PQQ-binding-like beta-propeller repeat protein [Methyloprofundus sp.]